ncbi:MAG: hypothetical protein K2Q25_14170 [Mycobacteriaceae bacterium]|nr:hypothetical protein [Mycobacteriaceae bacterium]
MSGHCRASGMIAARDQLLSAAPEPTEWQRYRRTIAQTGVELQIRDNQLVACLVDGHDIKDEVAQWTRSYGLGITECSIGTNSQVLASADWSLNSLMNESAQGIHLGFGLYDGMHVDFICPEVAVVTADTPGLKTSR